MTPDTPTNPPVAAPTPRTDAARVGYIGPENRNAGFVLADFARTLERELAAKDAEIARRKAQLDMWTSAAMDGNAAIAQLTARAEKAEADSIQIAKSWQERVGKMNEEIAQLRAEVERLRSNLNALLADTSHANCDELAAAQATAREAMEEADHYKRIFKSNGASMELMASRIPTGGQVIDAVIRAAAVTADSPGVLVWSASAAEQIEAALAKIAEEGQAQP